MTYRSRALLLASLALTIRRFRKRQEQDEKSNRGLLVPKMLSEKRKEQSKWENLSCELDEDDLEYYYKYFRVSPERFEHLFNIDAPFITKQDFEWFVWINVIRVIDGKHKSMDCPKNTGLLYQNYRGFFSQVLLAVCVAKYEFISIEIRQYGSSKDGAVLQHSKLGIDALNYIY